MKDNYFNVLRSGVNTTFQDLGFKNYQHLGISTGGAVDNNLFNLANKLLDNKIDTPILEFTNRGPLLYLKKGKCRFAITGNVKFNIIKNEIIIVGIPNRTYFLNQGEQLDILCTTNSNYGYLSIEGGFKLKKIYGSCSTLTGSKIGANEGKKIFSNQLIFFNSQGSSFNNTIDINFKISNFIRVIRGPQMNYFMLKNIFKFFNKKFSISNSTNRMGIRLEGNTIKATVSHNISSEGIIKGAIQIPGSGNPIVLINDHPTIGGYPKIANVILSDIAPLAQLPVKSVFNFKEVTLCEAENIYKKDKLLFNNKLNEISKI